MTRLAYTLIAIAAVLTASCGRPTDVRWKDGNFKVYATDSDFGATTLGYDHHPGILGLVEAEVVAAGSTSEVVFVERLDRQSGRIEFYVVPKEGAQELHPGTVEGPFLEEEFRKIRSFRQLPNFIWRKKNQ